MAERSEMTREEIEEYIASSEELAGMSRGERDGEGYDDGDGGEQVKPE